MGSVYFDAQKGRWVAEAYRTRLREQPHTPDAARLSAL